MMNLKATWFHLTSNYSRDAKLIEDHWAEIAQTHSTPGRHYHNLSHLNNMTENAAEYKDRLIDPDTVMFSIFYHDFVYHPLNKDNEQKSANLARDRLRMLGVPDDKIIKSCHQILATKDHQDNANNDIKYLLDFDLAILGAAPAEYKIYTNKIRKEFPMFPDLIYRKGRKKVLQRFLNMTSIFKTEEFKNSCEQQARINLQSEMEDL